MAPKSMPGSSKDDECSDADFISLDDVSRITSDSEDGTSPKDEDPEEPLVDFIFEEVFEFMHIKRQLESIALIVSAWVIQLADHKYLEATRNDAMAMQLEVAMLLSTLDLVTPENPYVRGRANYLHAYEEFEGIKSRYFHIKPIVERIINPPTTKALKRKASD